MLIGNKSINIHYLFIYEAIVILSQWVKGEGLKFIMDEAIKKRA